MGPRTFCAMLAWLCLSALMGGCDRIVGAVFDKADTERVEAPVLAAPTEAEVQAFVAAFDPLYQQHDIEGMVKHFDVAATLQLAGTGLTLPRAALKSAIAEGDDALRAGGTPAVFVGALKGGGSVTRLRVERDQGGVWLRYRVIYGGGGFDHLRLLLAKRADGPPRVVDLWSLSTSERGSETARRMLLFAVPRDTLEYLDGTQRKAVERALRLVKFQQAVTAEQGKQALALYDELPDAERRDRYAMVLRIQAAQQLGDDDGPYLKALEEFIAAFPDDPLSGLHAIDAAFMQKDYARAREAVQSLAGRVGPDAYLTVMRGQILLAEGKVPEARTALVQAMAEEPGLRAAQEAMLDVTLAEGNFAETARVLVELERQGLDFGDLRRHESFATFVTTPHYQSFLAQRPSNAEEP